LCNFNHDLAVETAMDLCCLKAVGVLKHTFVKRFVSMLKHVRVGSLKRSRRLKKIFEDAVNCTRSFDCHSLFSAGNFL
jgi:hypothetical protein